MTLAQPARVVFTFAFPLILIVLFSALQRQRRRSDAYGEHIRFAQFYTPRHRDLQPRHRLLRRSSLGSPPLVTRGCSSGCADAAADGHLPRLVGDRRHAVPASPRSRCCSSVAIPAFGVDIYADHAARRRSSRCCSAPRAWPRSACAVASLVKNADQAMPVAQLTFLPVSFISASGSRSTARRTGSCQGLALLPALRTSSSAFGSCFVPGASGSQFRGSDLLAHRDLDRGRPVRGGAALPLGALVSRPMSWFKSAVVYQIYPRSLRGLRRRRDR